jgi:hypothetical protein
MKDFCIIAFDKQKKTMKLAFNMLLFSTICNSIYDCLKKKEMEKELLFGHSNVVVIRLHITANNMDEKQTQSVTKKKDSIFMATLKPFKKLGAVLRSR